MTVFPTLSDDMDSSKFMIEFEDNTISDEMEGGYTITRSRTTRRSRKLFKGGYTCLTNADKALLEALWIATSGKAGIIQWICPQDGTTYLVRFNEKLAFKYMGRGTYQRWDCDIAFRQV